VPQKISPREIFNVEINIQQLNPNIAGIAYTMENTTYNANWYSKNYWLLNSISDKSTLYMAYAEGLTTMPKADKAYNDTVVYRVGMDYDNTENEYYSLDEVETVFDTYNTDNVNNALDAYREWWDPDWRNILLNDYSSYSEDEYNAYIANLNSYMNNGFRTEQLAKIKDTYYKVPVDGEGKILAQGTTEFGLVNGKTDTVVYTNVSQVFFESGLWNITQIDTAFESEVPYLEFVTDMAKRQVVDIQEEYTISSAEDYANLYLSLTKRYNPNNAPVDLTITLAKDDEAELSAFETLTLDDIYTQKVVHKKTDGTTNEIFVINPLGSYNFPINNLKMIAERSPYGNSARKMFFRLVVRKRSLLLFHAYVRR